MWTCHLTVSSYSTWLCFHPNTSAVECYILLGCRGSQSVCIFSWLQAHKMQTFMWEQQRCDRKWLEGSGLEGSIHSGWPPPSVLGAVTVLPCAHCSLCRLGANSKLPWVIKMTSCVFIPAEWATLWNLRAPQYIGSPSRWLNGPF